MNVKLVAQLRQKVKTKVKAALEGGADKGKEQNRRYVVQKVSDAALLPRPLLMRVLPLPAGYIR